MNTLDLKIQGGRGLKPIIKIDGNVVNYKRNKNQSIEIKHETDKNNVSLSIENILEINGPCWWLVQMLFFVVSIFGIFNTKLEKMCYVISYKCTFSLNEGNNTAVIKIGKLQDKAEVVTVVTNTEYLVEKNECVLDEKAQKRKKILKVSKILAWILLVLTVILLICVRR